MRKYLKRLMIMCFVLSGLLLVATTVLFEKAFRVGPKDFIDEVHSIWLPDSEWLKTVSKSKHRIQVDGLNLFAWYIPALEPSENMVVVAHGYGNNKDRVGHYIKLFHDAGYNVLAPDAQGHGESEGALIGFGWPERLALKEWIDYAMTVFPENEEVALYGISMGAATVMMMSGEQHAHRIVAMVEDAGYTSIADILTYQLKTMYALPSFPFIPLADVMAKIRLHYSLYEASALKSVQRIEMPRLFIHGNRDDFVPTTMVYDLYNASNGPKSLYLVEGANHSETYETNPQKYRTVVLDFLDQYFSNKSKR